MSKPLSLLLVLAACYPASAGTVYVTRHGEKVWLLGCLNGQGEARAKHLVNVFDGKAFQKPKYIFANWYDDPIDCERCNQTATPLAKSLGLKIDLTHGGEKPGRGPNGGNAGAATAIKRELQSTGGPVLAVWEHVNIQYLTQELGVAASAIPKWPGSDYDTIYVFEFDAGQNLTNFWTSHENFTSTAATVVV
eukprot:TRINITY_DN75731_c0_g1_i1.p1 TRINITY_DN75731_c0_g1~~TRINITY_DN75731_c0_g1_i1.p1  ORF type:complete len:223 (+),score=18.87 TRINITY_DN75731_c0_g1_i1:95-670(+)